jgi:hypothetical protein
LKENEKLMFIKSPTDQVIEHGKRIVLECTVNDDSAEYMWLVCKMFCCRFYKTTTSPKAYQSYFKYNIGMLYNIVMYWYNIVMYGYSIGTILICMYTILV